SRNAASLAHCGSQDAHSFRRCTERGKAESVILQSVARLVMQVLLIVVGLLRGRQSQRLRGRRLVHLTYGTLQALPIASASVDVCLEEEQGGSVQGVQGERHQRRIARRG